MRSSVSLAMIVKDEERTLERVLLAATQFCDQLVVVDTGSSDSTVEIAKRCGAEVFHFPWVDDFSAARNYSFAQCLGDWILWLDADDLLPPETIAVGQALRDHGLAGLEANCVRCPYIYEYSPETGEVMLKQFRERFVRRSAGFRWVAPIHEVLDAIGTSWTACTDFVVEHRVAPENKERKQGRNLRIYDKTLDRTKCDTRDLYLYAGELRAARRFAEALECYELYFQRWPAGERDHFEEPYIARIDRIDCLRRMGDLDAALRFACEAIYYNSTRAEAYALAALCHHDCENWHAAYALFLAAAACKAPTHGGVVYEAFYSKHIRNAVEECRAKILALEPAVQPVVG